jgi:hypothetical protein
VPGIEGPGGADGTDGTDGVSSYTVTTAPFTLPAAASTVSVAVANASWMVAGQNIFISDGTNQANFTVSSITGSTSVVLTYLDYTGDAGVGSTIATGAGVSVGGLEGASGSAGTAVTGTISVSTGLTQALDTTANTQVGTTTLTLAASSGKNYMLFARLRVDYAGATIAATAPTITFKLRRTNNTAADVTNATAAMLTEVVTTFDGTAAELTIIGIPYTTQGASDIIQPMASVDSLTNVSAGAINCITCSLSAMELT